MTLVTASGLAFGWGLDQLLGDPRRGHPVAGFGCLATALEHRTYAERRLAGAGHVMLLAGGAVGAGIIGERLARPGWARLLVIATTTWAVLGGRSLDREAAVLTRQLSGGDLVAARRQVRNLVGRDPAGMDARELARAVVESLAENTSDAVVAPLLWGALAGMPGLLGYRAVNTLDAMIGHHSPRYERFGWAAARLDDVANWLPARLAAALTAVVAPLVGGSSAAALATVRRDAGRHPSPNAGVVEAAFAGALGVRLGGTNVYGDRVERRGPLGDGPPVDVADVARARRLARAVGLGALLAALALAVAAKR